MLPGNLLSRRRGLPGLATAGGAALIVIMLSQVLTGTAVFDATTAAVTAMTLVSLGILTGAGILCLCQLSFAAIGAWTVSQLSLWSVPGGLLAWMVIGGAAAGLAGLVIGLTALRLRGIQLAIVTLAFGALIDSVLTAKGFPGSAAVIPVSVPPFLSAPSSYLLFAGFTLIAVAFTAVLFARTRTGRGLRSLRQSERATAAIGCNVAGIKLAAFGVSACLAGVAGGIAAGQSGVSVASTYAPVQSLSLVALAIMIGVEYVDGAIIGGILATALPILLADHGLPSSWSLMLFGAATIPALRGEMPPGEKLRRRLYARRGSRRRPVMGTALDPHPRPVATLPRTALEISHVSVRYGHLTALDDVNLSVRRGEVVGLIGPNGAGKSTLVDVVSGFIKPQAGEVQVNAVRLSAQPPYVRARLGLRRTFQQDRVPLGLRVGQYLRLAAGHAVTDEELCVVLNDVGGPEPAAPIAVLDAGTRRLVEVAGGLLARPPVLLLDEPTAGLGLGAKTMLAERLPSAAARYDTGIVLIEHDLDLVRAACQRVWVLDYGKVLAEGTPDEVLHDRAVQRAYLGGEIAL